MPRSSTPSSRASRNASGDAYAGSASEALSAGAGGAGVPPEAGSDRPLVWGTDGGGASPTGATSGGSAVAGPASNGSSPAGAPFDAAIVAIGVPSETLSPSLTSSLSTTPATGAGISIVALSDSSVTSGASTSTVSPSFTRSSITGTSVKSPMSGTATCVISAMEPRSRYRSRTS